LHDYGRQHRLAVEHLGLTAGMHEVVCEGCKLLHTVWRWQQQPSGALPQADAGREGRTTCCSKGGTTGARQPRQAETV
jgi:hypothetical protein